MLKLAPTRVRNLFALALTITSAAESQTVRGTVTERGSGIPLAGSLITLDREGSARFDNPLQRATTNATGTMSR